MCRAELNKDQRLIMSYLKRRGDGSNVISERWETEEIRDLARMWTHMAGTSRKRFLHHQKPQGVQGKR